MIGSENIHGHLSIFRLNGKTRYFQLPTFSDLSGTDDDIGGFYDQNSNATV